MERIAESRHRVGNISCALLVGFVAICASPALAADDEPALRRLLSIFSTVRIGDDYDAIKKLAPEIGPLHEDVGDDNTEALFTAKVDKIVLRGEFNFSKGRLVSHGSSTGELSHPQAHDFLLRCITILEELNGQSERSVELPSESDGPPGTIGVSFNWHKEGALLGLDFHYRRQFASVSWGAQAE
jgi:hypothetical protein